MNKKLSAKLRVRSYELDSYGHVNNATYLQYLEFARFEYMKEVGISLMQELASNYQFFVVNANLNFKGPAFLDDELEIIGSVKKIGKTSFTLNQDVYNVLTGTHILNAEITLVFIDNNGKPALVPEKFKNTFIPYLLT